MTITDRVFVLKSSPPFDRLRDSEIALIAESMKVRRYEPGDIICGAGLHLQKLYVVAEGDLLLDTGEVVPHVFGLQHLLFDKPPEHAVVASPKEGACCLTIGKSGFFTMIYECPILIVEFLQSSDTERPASSFRDGRG